MLFLVGLGLGDAKDITVKGLEIVKNADEVYLENYTSILCSGQADLEQLYERKLTIVDREMMEQGCDQILDVAEKGNAAVLVVGDPLNATTHTDLLLRCTARNIGYQIVHNASILNAVACCGLQIYSFGETVSIPFWTDTWKPESFYDKIQRNRANGMHTLCLLDIKVKECNLELMIKGITKMDPPRFMSFSQAAEQLLAISRRRRLVGEGRSDVVEQADKLSNCEDLDENTVCIGLARVGSSSQMIVRTILADAINKDLGQPLHSLVVPAATLHPLEEEMIALFSTTIDQS